LSHHIIEAQNIYFNYPDGHNVINGISFKILHGESVGIIGSNGAGKSTLLMLLMGLIFTEKGNISIGEVKINKKNLNIIRQRMGMLFQDPDDQLFMPTVYEDVAFGPRNFNLDEDIVKKRVIEALEKTGTFHLSDRSPCRLSSGEKRSAALASVLSMTPDILILDEPTSFLDPKSRRRLINLLNTFKHTKIITTHDLDMVYDLCERTIIIKDGKLIADDISANLLTNKKLLDSCGLEVPLSLQNCPVCKKAK